MQLARPAFASDPKRFGKARARELAIAPQESWTLGSDLKLFATTFVAGFLFVSILIG
ncbi:MAG: hypothetical protein ACM3ZV_14090 [Bacillota bacterium]